MVGVQLFSRSRYETWWIVFGRYAVIHSEITGDVVIERPWGWSIRIPGVAIQIAKAVAICAVFLAGVAVGAHLGG